jgi:hypothetical protein
VSRRARALSALGLALAVLAGGAALAQGVAVEGVDRARLLAPAGAAVTDYANAGYRLTWRDGEALVEVRVAPLHSTAGFTPRGAPGAPGDSAAGAVARLARAVTAGAVTRYEAVSRLLDWVARNVRYELDRTQDQSAEAVLERRRAYCTGVARLSVALLEAVGIEAREVAGWVAADGPAPAAGAAGYHRWIEVLYPDRGWVFSDPLVSHHFVPASYLRLADDQVADGLAGGLLLERRDRVSAVDLYARAPAGIRAGRNLPRQLAAALEVVADVAGAEAVLEGKGVRRRQALRAGRGVFVGLEPGRYALRLQGPGLDLERVVTLRGLVRASVYLPLASAGGEGAGEAR